MAAQKGTRMEFGTTPMAMEKKPSFLAEKLLTRLAGQSYRRTLIETVCYVSFLAKYKNLAGH